MDFRSLMPFGRPGALTRRDMDDPFAAMRREMERMFDAFGQTAGFPAAAPTGLLSPNVDVAETDKGLEIKADLPGVSARDIEVDLSDGVLTLKAEHRQEREEKDEKTRYHLVERSYGTYLRRFPIPFEADEDKIEADFDKGVLKVVIPRSEAAKKQARRIEIKGD